MISAFLGGNVASGTAAHTDIQLVSFFLHGEEYAIDVMSVREIISMVAITRTDNSPFHVEGIIDLRGTIVPILSLRKRFGMPASDDTTLNCIAIMDYNGKLTGFIIDEVSDVMRIKQSDILPPLEAVAQPWITGLLTMEQRLVVVMNLRYLAEE